MITLHEHPKGYRAYYLHKEDWVKLNDYYSQSVPFVGTSGKYCISSSIVYPRYKIKASFEAFNQVSTSKRSIAKNESYADYIVIPVKQFKQLLTNQATQNTLDGKPIVIWHYISAGTLAKIKNVINHYNSEYSSKPFIDFDDFSNNLDALKERLTIDKTEPIISLLTSGDSGSRKLGMEMLTNYDIARSVVAIVYCLSKCSGIDLRTNEYYNSTAFKGFRERFAKLVSYQVDSFLGISYTRTYTYLISAFESNTSLTIARSEYEIYKKIMCSVFIDKASSEGIILDITPENLTLKFDESKIIPDELIDHEDKLREEAALEDPTSSYYLLDDTTETA